MVTIEIVIICNYVDEVIIMKFQKGRYLEMNDFLTQT